MVQFMKRVWVVGLLAGLGLAAAGCGGDTGGKAPGAPEGMKKMMEKKQGEMEEKQREAQ